MRLINCTTLKLEEFLDDNIPPYAILSHTWGKEEVSLAEFTSNDDILKSKEGFIKIAFACSQALRDQLQYTWVDTCCIDKTSSAELSEAINSMFQWYKSSTICYAYLTDVMWDTFDETFPQSRWWSRGWTLQELLAPSNVTFFDRNAKSMGTKSDHSKQIAEITGIDEKAVTSPEFETYSVAQRMSWASNRQTTRVEDIAYSLLGLFNVSMPLLYGEGETAFLRLQEEIIRRSPDESIFAWGLNMEVIENFEGCGRVVGATQPEFYFAQSPKDFRGCHVIETAGVYRKSPFILTNVGLQVQLPLVPIRGHDSPEAQCWIGLLNCRVEIGDDSKLVGVVFRLAGVGSAKTNVAERAYVRVSTALISPLIATFAVQTNMVLHGNNGSSGLPIPHAPLVRQFVVFIKQSLRIMEYSVFDASRWEFPDSERSTGVETSWNQTSQTLSATCNKNDEGCIYIFNFRSSGRHQDFSVFVLPTNLGPAAVRRGCVFSEEDMQSVHRQLKYKIFSGQESTLETLSSGMEIRVEVEKKEKNVCHWMIQEVHVGSIRFYG
jgi:hypothetical protein